MTTNEQKKQSTSLLLAILTGAVVSLVVFVTYSGLQAHGNKEISATNYSWLSFQIPKVGDPVTLQLISRSLTDNKITRDEYLDISKAVSAEVETKAQAEQKEILRRYISSN